MSGTIRAQGRIKTVNDPIRRLNRAHPVPGIVNDDPHDRKPFNWLSANILAFAALLKLKEVHAKVAYHPVEFLDKAFPGRLYKLPQMLGVLLALASVLV